MSHFYFSPKFISLELAKEEFQNEIDVKYNWTVENIKPFKVDKCTYVRFTKSSNKFLIERNISNLNRVAKLKLFKSMIIPVLLYASPCFSLNKYIMSELETIQQRAVKWICVNSVPYKENKKT